MLISHLFVFSFSFLKSPVHSIVSDMLRKDILTHGRREISGLESPSCLYVYMVPENVTGALSSGFSVYRDRIPHAASTLGSQTPL